MADLSSLGELRPVEPLDLSEYKDSSESFSLPKKGRYTVKAPDSFPSTTFGRSRAGALTAQIDPTIVGPSNEGFTLRFTKVSAKTFKRQGVSVSQLGDYLRACGFRGRISDEQAQADAIEQTANTVYEVDCDWRAFNKVSGYALEGMENFPSDGNGGHLSWTEDPTDKDEEGNPKRVRANIQVVRFVPKVGG